MTNLAEVCFEELFLDPYFFSNLKQFFFCSTKNFQVLINYQLMLSGYQEKQNKQPEKYTMLSNAKVKYLFEKCFGFEIKNL